MRDPNDSDELDDIPPDVVRFVAGECSATEAADLQRRIMADAGLARQVELARQVWLAADLSHRLRDIDRGWDAVRAQLDGQPAEHATPIPRGRGLDAGLGHSRAARSVAAVAAAMLALALPAAALWWLPQRPSTAVVPATAPAREYVTVAGERAELRLPDGTRVMLGVASRLTLPGDFGRTSREVSVDGQAYFDVVHDTTRPFRVRTAVGVAEDIGTAFVVTTYPETRGMQVAVASGVVTLAASARPNKLVLKRGDLGQVDSAGGPRVEHGVDLDAQLAWTRGELVFRRAPLRQVLPQLERWYGIRLRLGSRELDRVPVSASFADQPPAEAVEFIAAAVGGRVVRQAGGDSVFTLYSR